jgi:NADH-quinone oxidoreductase subunit L
MIVPLVILAVLSVVGGWIGLPMIEGGHVLGRWLAPVFAAGPGHAAEAHEVSRGTEWALIAVSVGVAVLGIVMAFRMYLQKPSIATALRERLAGVHALLFNKYWIDELYDSIVVRPVVALSQWFWRFWDTKIVDGAVNGMAYVFEGASAVLRLVQTGFVGTYALFFTLGVAALILHFLRH